MITCTVTIGFDAAKRLMEMSGKCSRLHGYHHVIEATFASAEEEDPDLVMDFHALEALLGMWIEDHWEHNLILNKNDEALGRSVAAVTGQKVYYMPSDPTAEALAAHLFRQVIPALLGNVAVRCTRVRLYDTPQAFVEIS